MRRDCYITLFCSCIFPIHENSPSCIFNIFSWHWLSLRHSCCTGAYKAKDWHHLINSGYKHCHVSFFPTFSFENSPTIFNRKHNVSLRSFLSNCSRTVGDDWVQRLILANGDGPDARNSSRLPHGVTKGGACALIAAARVPCWSKPPVQHLWHLCSLPPFPDEPPFFPKAQPAYKCC